MKSQVIPEAFLKCMRPEDRKAFGKAGMTAEEAILKFSDRTEKELQKQIYAELTRRGIFVIASGMHRKTSTAKGTPDFCFCVPGQYRIAQAWAIECKTATGQLRPEQEQTLKKMARNGWHTLVCRSFEQFKQEVFGA